MEKKETAKLYAERLYPYVISAVITIIAIKFKVNFAFSKNLNSALDACNTVVALIIGFLGAVLPVILGMKNESKIVKYVFKRDKNKLFLKYIKSTILWGLVTVAVTISMYMINDFNYSIVGTIEFYVWIFLVVLFLILTYRSLKIMLDLVFLSDNDLPRKVKERTAEEKEEIEEIEDVFDEEKR